jgi:hypothetical protein
MKHPLLYGLALAGLCFAWLGTAQSEPCVGCKDAVPMTDQETIKAARAKFDRELKSDTRRPWDGLNLGHRKPEPAAAPVGTIE